MINQVRNYQASFRQKKLAIRHNLKVINVNELSLFKNRTFFILGSGSSICELSTRQWELIDQGFSVGMNKWLIHDFIPDAMSLEKNWHLDFYAKLYNQSRITSSKKLKYIFYPSIHLFDFDGFPFDFSLENLNKIRLHGAARKIINSKEGLDELHQGAFTKKISENLQKKSIVFEKTGSVYRLLQFAIGSGFKHIVLCGVDLNGNESFWDKDPTFLKKRGVKIEDFTDQSMSKLHPTEAPKPGRFSMSTILESLNCGINGEIKIQVSSPNSKLADFLSIWAQ